MDTENSRFIFAKYTGKCHRCGGAYVAGTKIAWHFTEKRGAHLHCPAEDAAAVGAKREHAWLSSGWFGNAAGQVVHVERLFAEYVVTVWAPGHGLLVERVTMGKDVIVTKWPDRFAHRPNELPV